MIDPVRLFHPSRPERIALVTVEPASGQPGAFMVQVARGKKRTALTDARMFGPFSAEEVALAHKSIVDGLFGEGYVAGGLGQLLLALKEKNPRTRARAERRIGWRGEASAVEPLLQLLDKPKDDVSSVVDALGALGDVRALPAVRAEAERKLLSRRRAGVEALLQIGARAPGDVTLREALEGARDRAVQRLPDAVRSAVTAAASTIINATAGVDARDRGITADTLYELGAVQTFLALPGPAGTVDAAAGKPPSPVDIGALAARSPCVEAALAMLTTAALHQPYTWRYTKSVWKRAQVRRDYATFGLLSYCIEIAARTQKAHTATLKSGYDGETKKTRVFSRSTVDYVRRRAWRWLRRLAKHRPEEYALAAAEAVVHYKDGDDVIKGNSPATGRSYMLHRVLFGASNKYTFDGRQMRFKNKPKLKGAAPALAPSSGGDAPYAELWDRTPRAFVRLLGGARHSLVQRFALEGVTRHPEALQAATHADVAALLDSDDARIVDLGLTELRRRFDPNQPDLDLVLELAGSQKDLVRNHGLVWLNESAHVWTRRREWILRFLSMPQPASRDAAARLVNLSVKMLEADERRRLAGELLDRVEHKEPEESAFSGFAAVLREGLLDEAAAACPISRAIALVGAESDSAIAVGASILAKKPGAYDVLGLSQVLALATHEKAAVRRAAMTLLESARAELQRDPSVLFGLVESDWDDVRAEALKLIDGVDLLPLGLDGLMGLADSTRVDVQKKAHEILERAIAAEAVDVHELLARLGQHPSPVTRRYAVDMAVKHLKPGFVRLAKLELLFRAALFDVWPERQVKRTVIAFLGERGQQDENQAGVAAQVLSDFVRTQCVDDRERALEALVKIKLAFPSVEVPHLVVKEAA